MRHARRLLITAAVTGLLLGTETTVGAAGNGLYGARGGDPSMQQAIGSSWTVTTLEWPDAEKTRGSYNFAAFDAMVDAQAAVGVETQFRVHTCALTPEGKQFWGIIPLASGVDVRTKDPCTQGVPKSQSDWYNFVYNLALHYKNSSHPVRRFAIANEVNTPGQWPGAPNRMSCTMSSCPVFDDYITTLRTAQKAAHAANPNAIVLDAGLSSPTMGVATTRAKYEAGGKSDAALKAAISYLNKYFAYRHPPNKALPWQYINPNQTTSQLRAQFTKNFYGSNTQSGDRPFYFATRLYGTGAMDALQLHFYDYAPYIVDVIKFMRARGGGSKPIYCWECGIKWPVLDGKLYNYDPALTTSFLQQKAKLGFANGMVQLTFLPMIWGKPPETSELDKDLPLFCGPENTLTNSPGLCPTGSNGLSNVGAAFRALATG